MKSLKTLLILSLGVLVFACKPTPPESSPAQTAGAQLVDIASSELKVQKAPSFDSYIGLGLSYTRAGKHAEALNAFQKAASINPRAPVAYNNICSEHSNLKQWNQAIENCQKALELEPTFVLAKNNLAHARKLKALQAAKMARLEENIRAGKDTDRSRLDLGMEYYSQGNYETAVEVWRHVSDKSEHYPTVLNNLASAYIIMKKFDLAKINLDRALELAPGNALFKNNQRWLQTARQAAAAQ